MTKLILTAAIALGTLVATTAPADAAPWSRHRHHDRHYDRHHHHGYGRGGLSISFGSPRSVYVIERGVPVRRSYYYDDGRYYRVVGGRRVYVRERVYTSYPRSYHRHGSSRTVVIRR